MILPPAFVDSSSCWKTNHNQQQLQQIGSSTHITATPSPAGPGDGGGSNQEWIMATAWAGEGCGAGDGDGSCSGNSKPLSMSERARLVRAPRPVPGLNCPRCDSTNTKFCYFNNYSLTQPRHFCRACRRYWTRNVPIGGGYRRHAKRRDKTKKAWAAFEAAVSETSSAASTPNSTSCAPGTGTAPPGLQYSMFGSGFTESFDPASLGLSFHARLLFADSGAYAADSCVQEHHNQAHGNGMDSFPFLHAMDNQMSGPRAEAMPITVAAMQGMSACGGNGDDGGDHQFDHLPAKRDQQQWHVQGRG